MVHLRTILLQIAIGGTLSAAAAAVWVLQAVSWGHSNWFDRMAEHGLADLALIVPTGAAVGLAVWLCDRGNKARSGWLIASLAVLGMLVLHFLTMSVVPRGYPTGTPVEVSTVLRMWPWLAPAAFIPLAAALAGYWMSTVVLVVSLQTVVGGPASVYLAMMMGMAPPGNVSPESAVVLGVVLGLAVWLLGLMHSPLAMNSAHASFIRLLITVASSTLGFVVSQLLMGARFQWPFFYAALLVPFAGAMAGYSYWRQRPA